jgi:hypothetical protein
MCVVTRWTILFLYSLSNTVYAKPLLFTPQATGKQLIFLASSMNYVRTLDAVTGDIINFRQVQTPFLQSDIGCTDIPNYIGIIGTPVIDPTTEIAYFYAKTYIPNYRTAGATGVINGMIVRYVESLKAELTISTLMQVYTTSTPLTSPISPMLTVSRSLSTAFLLRTTQEKLHWRHHSSKTFASPGRLFRLCWLRRSL